MTTKKTTVLDGHRVFLDDARLMMCSAVYVDRMNSFLEGNALTPRGRSIGSLVGGFKALNSQHDAQVVSSYL